MEIKNKQNKNSRDRQLAQLNIMGNTLSAGGDIIFFTTPCNSNLSPSDPELIFIFNGTYI